MNTTLSLRYALLANAAFSTTSALLLMIYPAVVGQWLGLDATMVYQVVGAGLMVFAADLVHQATRRRIATWRALYASVADFTWVLGTLALVAFNPTLFTSQGNALVASVAAVVFCFGAWQFWAIGRAHQLPVAKRGSEYRHCIMVEVNAAPELMWRVISDLGGIKNYMPSLKSSLVVGDCESGVGAVRMCEDRSGKRWSEECIEFNNSRSFTVRFLSEAPDFPFPAREMRGGWEVMPSEAGSRVMVWWELIPKQKFLAPIILPILARQVDRDFPAIIRRMAAGTRQGDEAESRQIPPDRSGVVARLIPEFC